MNGPLSFEFDMEDIKNRIRTELNAVVTTLEGYEFQFNVSVYDWFFRMTREGYASTVMVQSKSKLQWVGDKVRSFKPDSVLTVQVRIGILLGVFYSWTICFHDILKGDSETLWICNKPCIFMSPWLTVNMVILRWGGFRENVVKTFHVGIIFTKLLLFPQ